MEVYSPKVSVVIPVLNGEGSIAATISSLLSQDYPRNLIEIIVVDNGSSDGTRGIVTHFPVLCVDATPANRAVARNRGVSHASGELIFFIDCDCQAEITWISTLAAVFQDPKVVAVQGTITPAGARKLSYATFDHAHLGIPFLDTKGCAIRKTALDACGGFNEALCRCEDIDLSWRLIAAGGVFKFLDSSGVESGTPRGILMTMGRAFESAQGMRQVHSIWAKQFNLNCFSILKGFLSIGSREMSRRGVRSGLGAKIRMLYLLDSILTGIFYIMLCARAQRQ